MRHKSKLERMLELYNVIDDVYQMGKKTQTNR